MLKKKDFKGELDLCKKEKVAVGSKDTAKVSKKIEAKALVIPPEALSAIVSRFFEFPFDTLKFLHPAVSGDIQFSLDGEFDSEFIEAFVQSKGGQLGLRSLRQVLNRLVEGGIIPKGIVIVRLG